MSQQETLQRPYFYFDRERLMNMAESLKDQYASNSPFPHIVIDDFLPPEVLDGVLEEFPAPGEKWKQFDNQAEIKLANNVEERMGSYTRHVINQFNCSAMCHFIEVVTGIPSIIPDPHLFGGGLHQLVPGGFLKIHADYNWHKELKLHRRVNLILYLNKDWKDEYGGHLELWDEPMENCVQKVLPIFNRAVIFTTTSTSWHGNPGIIACPEGNSRKSLAFYYYTQDRPEGEKQGPHTTIFKQRPNEKFKGARKKSLAELLLPPIITDWRRESKKKKQYDQTKQED